MNFPSSRLGFFHLPLQTLPLDERYFYTSWMILPTHLNSKAAFVGDWVASPIRKRLDVAMQAEIARSNKEAGDALAPAVV